MEDDVPSEGENVHSSESNCEINRETTPLRNLNAIASKSKAYPTSFASVQSARVQKPRDTQCNSENNALNRLLRLRNGFCCK